MGTTLQPFMELKRSQNILCVKKKNKKIKSNTAALIEPREKACQTIADWLKVLVVKKKRKKLRLAQLHWKTS